MNRPLAAVWLVALVAVFAIFAFSMHQDSPEPFALPPTMPVTAISDTRDGVSHVIVDNLATVAPEPTRSVWQTPTSAVLNCPGKDGALCQIPAPVLIMPTISVPSCNAESIATFVPGELCRWSDVTPTVSQQEELFR